ncbi:MAG: hypothetical protein GC154_12585 [bacterium]|nr:hypothetical protein [bacterium]
MRDSELRAARDYAELKASIERIRAKLESVESMMLYTRQSLDDLNKQYQKSRVDLAGVKTSAAIFGALTGSLMAALFRWALGGL